MLKILLDSFESDFSIQTQTLLQYRYYLLQYFASFLDVPRIVPVIWDQQRYNALHTVIIQSQDYHGDQPFLYTWPFVRNPVKEAFSVYPKVSLHERIINLSLGVGKLEGTV